MPEIVTRDDALEFLHGRIDYERFASMPYGERSMKLDRMARLLEEIDHPERGVAVVHIAGTKGKGSTLALLTSILMAAGFRVGGFTSPHLVRVEERILCDGVPCTEGELIRLAERIRLAVERMERRDPNDGPTFFEITTAMAWMHFAARAVDIAVLEVGMGGRLDSTNVCDPAVTTITAIGYDHVEQLGGTLEAIAREKAGIVKPSVPLVCGVREVGPREAIAEICDERNARRVQIGRDFDFSPAKGGGGLAAFDYRFPDAAIEYSALEIALLGRHQMHNASIAVTVAEELRRQGWAIGEEAIRRGLRLAVCPGRVEVARKSPMVIVDGGHNPAAIDALARTIEHDLPETRGRRRLIFACARDKAGDEMLARLAGLFDSIVVTQFTTSPRFCPAEELLQTDALRSYASCEVVADPRSAWRTVLDAASPDDLIVITGSMYLAGELRGVVRASGDS